MELLLVWMCLALGANSSTENKGEKKKKKREISYSGTQDFATCYKSSLSHPVAQS